MSSCDGRARTTGAKAGTVSLGTQQARSLAARERLAHAQPAAELAQGTKVAGHQKAAGAHRLWETLVSAQLGVDSSLVDGDVRETSRHDAVANALRRDYKVVAAATERHHAHAQRARSQLLASGHWCFARGQDLRILDPTRVQLSTQRRHRACELATRFAQRNVSHACHGARAYDCGDAACIGRIFTRDDDAQMQRRLLRQIERPPLPKLSTELPA